MSDNLLSVSQVCDIAGLSKQSVYSAIDRGDLIATTIAAGKRKRYVIHASSLPDYLAKYRKNTQHIKEGAWEREKK